MTKSTEDMTLEELRKAVNDKIAEYLRHGYTDIPEDSRQAILAAYVKAMAAERDRVLSECLEEVGARPIRKPVAPVTVVGKYKKLARVACPVCGQSVEKDKLLPMSVSEMLSELIAFAGEHREGA